MRHYIADNGAWTRLFITVTTKQQTQEQECLRHADTHSIIWAVTGCNQRSSLDAMPAQKNYCQPPLYLVQLAENSFQNYWLIIVHQHVLEATSLI